MTAQGRLGDKLSFRISPLLEMALSLLVILNPERFAPAGGWEDHVAARLSSSEMEALRGIATEIDLFAVACELDADKRSVSAVLEDLSNRNPDLGGPLMSYWTAFAPEAAANSGILGDSILRESARLREVDPLTFIGDFSDRVSISDDGQTLTMEWGRGMQVSLADMQSIEFIPSIFCPRRMMFYRHGRTQILFYNPLDRRSTEEVIEPPESLALGFSALADTTRLKLLKLIAQGNLSAQEMARRLEVHESTVSRHLRFLVEAGHVARQRQEGRTIFYMLNPDRLDTLAALFRGYLT